jgi:HlyD family secretion protein
MRWLVTGLVLAGLTGGAYLWRRVSAKLEDTQPRVISTVRPESRKVDATVSATGVIRLRSGAEVRVGAQLSGIVDRLNVTVGSHVGKGSIIADIDSRGLSARIEQAKAQVAMDEVAIEKSKRELARSQSLLAEGLIPRQQTEDLEEDLRGAEAKLAKSRQDLAVVEADLPYATVRAPIAGTVSSISTQEGETVAASFAAPTFVTILEDDALELVAMVDETDIGNVRRGDGVRFTVETYPDREYAGTVTRIAPAGTIISGVVNYEVGIRIRKPDGLKPDMTANVAITTAKKKALVADGQPTR